MDVHDIVAVWHGDARPRCSRTATTAPASTASPTTSSSRSRWRSTSTVSWWPPRCARRATTSSWPRGSASPRGCSTAPPCGSASTAGPARRSRASSTSFPVDTGGLAPPPPPRLTATTSACGICGTTAVDDLRERLHPLPPGPPFALDVLATVPDRVAGEAELFAVTGAVHAAVAFDRAGAPVLAREDIGRHNAVDKVVGRLLLDGGLPASELGLYVSGRASFEIVQKSWAAGVRHGRRGQRTVVAGRGGGPAGRHHAVRVRPGRPAQRLHPGRGVVPRGSTGGLAPAADRLEPEAVGGLAAQRRRRAEAATTTGTWAKVAGPTARTRSTPGRS